MKKTILLITGLCIGAVAPLSAEKWSVEVDYLDTCSCNVICPCLFGSDPTNRECLGQGFMRVTKGHYGDIDLKGVTLHHAYKMGTWERYIIGNRATQEQMDAMKAILEAAFVLPGGKIVSFTKGPVRYKRDGNKITLSAKNSEAELEAVLGSDGKPMRIANHPMFMNYQQFKAVKSTHKSEHGEFSNTGTNAFLAKRSASSES